MFIIDITFKMIHLFCQLNHLLPLSAHHQTEKFENRVLCRIFTLIVCCNRWLIIRLNIVFVVQTRIQWFDCGGDTGGTKYWCHQRNVTTNKAKAGPESGTRQGQLTPSVLQAEIATGAIKLIANVNTYTCTVYMAVNREFLLMKIVQIIHLDCSKTRFCCKLRNAFV